jgi:hypothetical protein
MPLFLRAMRDHYPDDDSPSARTMDGYVALSGSYACGHIEKSTQVRSDNLLDWGCGFGSFRSGGTVATVEEAKPAMAKAFREALERAGLAEIDDAKPGPPERKVPVSADGAWGPRSSVFGYGSSGCDPPPAPHERHIRRIAGRPAA